MSEVIVDPKLVMAIRDILDVKDKFEVFGNKQRTGSLIRGNRYLVELDNEKTTWGAQRAFGDWKQFSVISERTSDQQAFMEEAARIFKKETNFDIEAVERVRKDWKNEVNLDV